MNREEIDLLLDFPLIETIAYFSVAGLLLVIFLAIFELVTPYQAWEEIARGNLSIALAIAGKIFGICNVFRYALTDAESIYTAFLWAVVGYVLLLITYFLFEFLTPWFKVDKELERDNRAIGFISMILSMAFSYVVGASIQ